MQRYNPDDVMAQRRSSEENIKFADRDLKEIRKLGAKPEQRYFGIGPKKGPLSENDKQYKRQLEQRELTNRAVGMRQRRLAKGQTKLVRGKEVKK